MKPYVKVTSIGFLILVVLSVAYFGVVAYTIGYLHGESYTRKHAIVKTPLDYDIWKHYVAEKLQGEPSDWNTTEELGIILVESKVIEGRYHIFIGDEEKALPWMKGTKPLPNAVKYEDELYQITWLYVTPGVPEPNWLIPIGVILGAGWILTGILFLKLGKKE